MDKQPKAFDFIGLYKICTIDPNLDGNGIKIALISRSYAYPTNDYSPAIDHNCFAESEIQLYDDGISPIGISPHATAVASILVGNDPNAAIPELGFFGYQGAAPAAALDIYEFKHFISTTLFKNEVFNADIISMSLGSQFEDWWTDGINRLAEKTGIPIVAGVGNGKSVNDPPLYPAASPNVLGVGVANNIENEDFFESLSEFAEPNEFNSSSGPTYDGRCKPDIVAPANCIAAYPDDQIPYKTTGNWSSFSTPVAAGAISLLIQKAKDDPSLSVAISPMGGCLLKAIIMNSAKKLPDWHKGTPSADDDHQTPLDFIQGAGILDAAAAYNQLVAGRADQNQIQSAAWDTNSVSISAPRTYYITADNAAYISATLVWNRHYQQSYPFAPMPEKDSDLRLELWGVDSANPQNDKLLDYSDSPVDNVEHIYFSADPNYSTYAIIVTNRQETNIVEQYAIAYNVIEAPQQTELLSYDFDNDGTITSADLRTLLEKLTSILLPPAIATK